MSRPKKTTEALEENQSVSLEVTPEVLETMIQNRKENRKAVKHVETDSIGKPNVPLAGVSPLQQPFELWVIDITMGNRPSTHPARMGQGAEGYATGIQVVKMVRPIRTTEAGAAKMNGATDWRQAGSPNHFVWCFPKGSVSDGQRLSCECAWEPVLHNGQVINHNFKLNIKTNNTTN